MTHGGEHIESMEIAGRRVGPGEPAFLIAEVAQSHDGSLGQAHAFINATAEAGAEAIKFQTHIAEAESTYDDEFRIKFSRQDAERFDYWKRTSFTAEQWRGLAEHARGEGLIFLSSPFSLEAVQLLRGVGVPAWKIGSGEFASTGMMDAMCETGLPILLSTGMSTHDEVAASVSYLRSKDAVLCLLQCTSKYPTPLSEVGLNVIDELRARHACPVGLSDHSGTVYPALAAIARGADLIELHLCFDRRMFGPDVPASVTFDDLALIVRARDAFHEMAMAPVDKDAMAGELARMRELFTKSLAPVGALEAGTVLSADMLTMKKPGTGISETELPKVIGRRLVRAVAPERLLRWSDIGERK